MTTRILSTVQVAVLLISASYGIGFLFGSGEMALSLGMAGGTYGVATAIGMMVVVCAGVSIISHRCAFAFLRGLVKTG